MDDLYFLSHTAEIFCVNMPVKSKEKCDMESYWQSAADMLQRIQQLETKVCVLCFNTFNVI